MISQIFTHDRDPSNGCSGWGRRRNVCSLMRISVQSGLMFWALPSAIPMRIVDLLNMTHPIADRLSELASTGEAVQAQKGRMLLDVVRSLESQADGEEVYGAIYPGDELWLSASNVTAQLSVDWFDYAPTPDGIPAMHYRLRVKHGGSALTDEARPQSAEEAGRIVQRAFRRQ